MPVEVRIPTIFRKFTDGEAVARVGPGTLAEVIDRLDAEHPGIKQQLLADDGDLHRFVNVYVNDEDARYLGKLDAEVADGDTVSLLPSVAGGAPPGA
ncbi:MAG TPA: MoaD/ThiS family protein [Actinomycetota bacterium]|nr:MoaD/ThiS family protein [Actinomycetota bacterium]